MTERQLDDAIGPNAIGINGVVRVELWPVDRESGEGPIVVTMTPGQAMAFCARLADASRRALQDALK